MRALRAENQRLRDKNKELEVMLLQA